MQQSALGILGHPKQQLVTRLYVRAGVILDPVYSGKAYHTLMDEMKQQPEQWKGRKVLFLHTGGLFGMYDKVSQLQPMLQKMDTADRMVVS